MSESVSACGCSYTAVSTATRGRVTRSAAPRNNCSTSEVADTIRSVSHFLESIKNFSGINQEPSGSVTINGHTWLQQDSQIYVPILEHLRDPAVLRNDI